jgi:VanZ family protein
MPARSPRSNKRIVLLLLLTIAGWIAILFTESSQPPAEIMSLVPGLDKLAHFLAFGVLGLLICALWFKLKPKPAIPLFSMPLLLVSLSGLIEESYQMLVPGRTGSLPDLLADVGGAVFAIFLANRIAVLSRACSRFLP